MDIKKYKDILLCLKYLIAAEKWQGHVFAVGGCCRDSAMGSDSIKDIDLVVDLPNGGIEFAESLYRRGLLTREPVTYPTYGTAAFELAAYPGETIEAVQTRAEKYENKGSRNPVTAFGSIQDDCMRRDLTINAIYWDVYNERYVDVCGKGFDDIRNKVIRTPADPDVTYDDDPLRILRCVRFSAKYMWPIDEEVFKSMKRNSKRLEIISAERICSDLLNILSMQPANAGYGVLKLQECGALEWALRGLDYESVKDVVESDAWNATGSSDTQAVLIERLSMLSYASSKYANAVDRLKLPLSTSREIAVATTMANWLGRHDACSDPAEARRFVKWCGGHAAQSAAAKCYWLESGVDVNASSAVLSAVADGWRDKTLPINGNDIAAVGYFGREIGVALRLAWDHYYENPGADKDELLTITMSEMAKKR